MTPSRQALRKKRHQIIYSMNFFEFFRQKKRHQLICLIFSNKFVVCRLAKIFNILAEANNGIDNILAKTVWPEIGSNHALVIPTWTARAGLKSTRPLEDREKQIDAGYPKYARYIGDAEFSAAEEIYIPLWK